MNVERQRAGFTLVEMMVVVVIIGVLLGLGAFATQSWLSGQRAKGGARSIADLMMHGRVEAIRTRQTHVLFLERDASGAGLVNEMGEPVVVLLIRDADGDGAPDAGEHVASIPADLYPPNSIRWGSAIAANEAPPQPAPNDNPLAQFPEDDIDFLCCTFTQPATGDPARWVAFFPDGTPRSFSVGPFNSGNVGSGAGAVYVTDGNRDYAVVLAALGGVRVHAWDEAAGSWRR